ncbi:hypothetical protein PICMEDRAFT_17163 [Pichia membranifaciens NRRL Y-2026]|uniref:Ribosomal RNA-processing protein 14/surfeit locus protein 6 C-terminal domain-containing protein n=1 Tax=Pichia membranifaciens NRRL Y-2026 TaxID=763406 RepID=A0A1E3NID4_9ASCO|nr:hypothetical protein PICMEDRAFT_17163 [Pichia membranifaciens NRRL Y-2026]ODQ45905.1 hypothetical protein PICMEDRAFT_17163 [Pichia membranifaciens NRRL Y-2026]
MGNSLEERLQQHSNSFDGLMSLIPAKYYYDAETSNQWQQKRKSKQEHQALKRRKLDPESSKNLSAKDVLKEAEKTATPVILPGEKFKMHQQALAKKVQENGNVDEEEEDDEVDDDEDDDEDVDEEMESDEETKKQAHSQNNSPKQEEDKDEELLQENVTIVFDDNGEELVGSYKKEELQQQQKQQQQNVKAGKKTLSKEEQEQRERKHKELKAKLQAKIQSMREKRKAPGTKAPGAATSRQQILEERRKKAELKKEMKRKEAESSDDDDDDDDDAENVEGEETQDNSSVMFGNIEFLDGERVSSDLTSSRRVGKKKGPSNKDIKGHLKKIEREKSRLGELDSDAKKKLEDKNKWQKALASVQGLKVKDDEKLLKKALRRKESKKRKSEREWKDRIQTVTDEKKMKADRRDENLRIRKANKGKGRKDQVKQLPSYKRSRANKKMPGGAKRAGFEGGIRSHKKK